MWLSPFQTHIFQKLFNNLFFLEILKKQSFHVKSLFVHFYQYSEWLIGFVHHCSPNYVIILFTTNKIHKEVTTAVNKTKKLINLLASLGEDVTIRDANEVHLKNNSTRIDIHTKHKPVKRPCPHCGSHSVKKHGKVPSWAMHIPQGERKSCRLLFKKQRFKCKNCDGTFFEEPSWIFKNSHLTVPLAGCIETDLKHFIPKKDIARINGVSPYFVDLVASHLVPGIPVHLPEVICLDETLSEVEEQRNSKTVWLRYITNFSDGKTGELLDILPFRTIKKLTKYFKKHFSHDERCKVKYLCCDMAKCYIGLVQKCFPNAEVCVDNYHVTNRLNTCVNDIRKKEQNRLENTDSHKLASELKHLSHKFTTSIYNQQYYWKDRSSEYLSRIKVQCDSCPELKDAYAMLQYFHDIFHSYATFENKIRDLDLWISVFEKSTSEAISKAVDSVKNHLSYIHCAWKNGYSNATCEGNNNGIQTIKNISFGIHSFKYFRTRALLVLGQPGVARTYNKLIREAEDFNSMFYEFFPPLDEYILAYDWKTPRIDMSLKGA